MKKINQAEYERHFGTTTNRGAPATSARLEKALEHALDIRKFEIQLYWQRTSYFWAFTAFAGAGFFAILGSEMEASDKSLYAYIIACVGVVFTWAWHLVNRGSKFWQENWENHVDMLEDAVTGPLYKIVLSRPPIEPSWHEQWLTGPQKISVSKVNQWVCTYLLLLWVALIVNLLRVDFSWGAKISWERVLVGLLTVAIMYLMRSGGRTYEGSYTHHATLRQTEIDSH